MRRIARSLLVLSFLTMLTAGMTEVAAAPAVVVTTAEVDGRQLAEVQLGGRPVIRIGASGGGLSPMERANSVAERLASLLAAGTTPEEVNFAQVNGVWAVLAGDQVIVTVDESAARARDSEPKDLAFTWASNIRLALGGRSLGVLDYWFPGGRAEVVGTEFGLASWYGPGFKGRRTANGEVFEAWGRTAAHRTLPFGTLVLVTNLDNGRSVVVKINDRGPWVEGRIIDLSQGAAEELDMVDCGLGPVRLDVIMPSADPAPSATLRLSVGR